MKIEDLNLDESLTTISVKVPRWVEDMYIKVGSDCDLDLSKTVRVVLICVAIILKRWWHRGPALSAFLEHLEFKAEQYNLFFERKR